MIHKAILIGVFFMCLIDFLQAPKDDAIATIQMDGLGHYRVDNYKIDKEKCVHFYDKVDTYVRFCGAYKITDMYEYFVKK